MDYLGSYINALLQGLIWPLMLYEVSSTSVEDLERITNRHLRKWLGEPPSWTLPLSSLIKEFKTAKKKMVLTSRDSPEELIREAGIEIRTSRKWSANQTENSLKHKDISRVTAVRRHKIAAILAVLWS